MTIHWKAIEQYFTLPFDCFSIVSSLDLAQSGVKGLNFSASLFGFVYNKEQMSSLSAKIVCSALPRDQTSNVYLYSGLVTYLSFIFQLI